MSLAATGPGYVIYVIWNKTMSHTRPAMRRRLMLQSLEARQMMAGDTATLGAGDLSNDGGSTEVRFSSNHAGGMNVCFGDGSVRVIRGSDTVTAQLVDAAMTDDPFFFDGIGTHIG